MTKVSEKQPWPIHRVSNNLIHPLPSESRMDHRKGEGGGNFCQNNRITTTLRPKYQWQSPHQDTFLIIRTFFGQHTFIKREILIFWYGNYIQFTQKKIQGKFDGFIRYKLGKARVWIWVWDILPCNRSKRWHFYGATHIYIQTKPPAQDIMLRFITKSERKLHFHCRFSQETHI